MSEPLSEKESERFQSALNAPPSDRLKMESPLFEVTSMKREADTDESPQSKKPKFIDKPLAFGGEPLQEYDGKVPYQYEKHERLPQHEVHSAHHKDNVNFHGMKLTQRLLKLLSMNLHRDDELKNYHKNFSKKSIFGKPGATRIGVIGDTSAGKSTLINLTLSAGGALSTESGASRSSTQVAVMFAHAISGGNFGIFVDMFHTSTIKFMLRTCLNEIMAFIMIPDSERSLTDNVELRQDATAGLIILQSLIPSLRMELKNLGNVEKFIKPFPGVENKDLSQLVAHLLGLIRQRAEENGMNWAHRRKTDSASTPEEVNHKITVFVEPDGLAAIVSEITIKFRSALLAQGIEIVDLPGLNDKNTHMRNAALLVLQRCSKIIVLIEMIRCLSKDNVRALLDFAIKMKTIENVILVIRDREEFAERKLEIDPDVTEEESAALETLAGDLADATKKRRELQSNLPDRTAEYEQQVLRVDELEQKFYLKRLDVRDQMFHRNFIRDYEDPSGNGVLQMLTVSHTGYKEHLAGEAESRKPGLPVSATGFPSLRDQLCRLPGDAEVEAFKALLEGVKKLAEELGICLDPDNLPSRDSVLAIFGGQLAMSLTDEHIKLQRSLDALRSALARIFTTWQEHITKKIASYISKRVAGGTIGACIKKKGVHKPGKKPILRMNQDFLERMPTDLAIPIKALYETVNASSSSAIEKVTGHINDLKLRLEQSERLGGIDMEAIYRLLEIEQRQCIRDVTKYGHEYTQDVHFAVVQSNDDVVYEDKEPSAFVKHMDTIYELCYAKYPPKWKGSGTLTQNRLDFVREALLRADGPFSKFSEEILERLNSARVKWSEAIQKRINEMHNNLKRVLLNSFEGKRMSTNERAKVAPAIRAEAKKVISEVNRMLATYKPKESGPEEEDLFVAQ